MMAMVGTAAAAGVDYGGCAGTVPERVLPATPDDYLAVLAGAGPGDLVRLAAGIYADGLPLAGVNGEPDRCIVIEGPATGSPALFEGLDCCNVISLANSSYLVVRQLEIDGMNRLGDGVKAEGTADWVHHVTLESLYIHDLDSDQQIVGINTKCPAWNWVIRRNVIERVGTGMYFGNSDGEDEFVHSLIEYNVVLETVGYNLQIKHQNGRATELGAPASGRTVVRHNVLSKAANSSSGSAARPNLLVGHWPLSGPGAADDYLIYGNFLYQNETVVEPLVQAEGNVILYDNLLVNDFGSAVLVQPHHDVPRRVRVFQNTVVAAGAGVAVSGAHPGFEQRLVGNAVFAGAPLSGGTQIDNVVDGHLEAGDYLTNPDGGVAGEVDRLDLYPLPGTLSGTAIDLSGLDGYADWDRDFNGARRPGVFRGAYAGEGMNPGWLPALEPKPEVGGPLFGDGFESGDTGAWSSAVP